MCFYNLFYALPQSLKPTISYLSPKEMELVHNALKVNLFLCWNFGLLVINIYIEIVVEDIGCFLLGTAGF